MASIQKSYRNKIITDALAASAAHIEPFQLAYRQLGQFKSEQSERYKANPDKLAKIELWTKEEQERFNKLIGTIDNTGEKIKKSIIPAMEKYNLSMDEKISIIDQVKVLLASQALKPRESQASRVHNTFSEFLPNAKRPTPHSLKF